MHAVAHLKNRGRALIALSGATTKTELAAKSTGQPKTLPLALSSRLKLALAGAAAVLMLPATIVSAQEIKGDPEAAKAKISMCTGCHAIAGYRASFPTVYHVPLIAGQKEQYLINALTAYRKGDRDHPTMRGIAGALSDQDIADLAAFYAQAE